MDPRKQQSELIFTSLFLHSLKYFFFFLPISNPANTGFPAAQNRVYSKTYTGLREKQLSKIASWSVKWYQPPISKL